MAPPSLHDQVLPPAVTSATQLADALVELAIAVGDDAVPLVADPDIDEIRLVLGPGAAPPAAWRVHGSAWHGVATTSAVPDFANSELPFGPYVAACLAAAAVCWITRGKDWQGDHLELSPWSLTSSATTTSSTAIGPDVVDAELDLVLAGIGAVGTAFLLTLWCCSGINGAIYAADDDVVDDTNRNRCLLFFQRHIDITKADTIRDTLSATRLSILAGQTRADTLVMPTTNLVSAVDRPESRDALQQRYPASIIQASTDNVRVEVLRCDPTIPTACLRCFNPPRLLQADDELRREFASLSDDELATRAQALGAEVGAVQNWIDTGHCSEVTGQLLAQFRTTAQEHQFSIGFASALAGVLLAGQAVKDALVRRGTTDDDLVLHGPVSRARFPLLDLGSRVAGPAPYGRDPDCPACQPGTPATVIWRQRFTG